MTELDPSGGLAKIIEDVRARKAALAKDEAALAEVVAATAPVLVETPKDSAPLTPGKDTSEGRLSAFVVRIGTILMTVGALVATIGPSLTNRVDLGVIGGSLAAIGAVLAGKTAQSYSQDRTTLKSKVTQ